MCGIVGYVGPRDSQAILLAGLARLLLGPKSRREARLYGLELLAHHGQVAGEAFALDGAGVSVSGNRVARFLRRGSGLGLFPVRGLKRLAHGGEVARECVRPVALAADRLLGRLSSVRRRRGDFGKPDLEGLDLVGCCHKLLKLRT